MMDYPENGTKAIVLASGGSKVAYEAGILYVMKAAGWAPRYVLGVSAGAISGGGYSMGRLDSMIRVLWDLDEAEVHHRRNAPAIVWRYLRGRLTGREMMALHDNRPIQELLRRELENARIHPSITFRAGRVNLDDGSYHSTTFQDGARAWRQILASATIPIYWPAVKDPAAPGSWVDGGVRDMAPLGELFSMELETGEDIGQVLLISTEPLSYKGGASSSILEVAKTTTGIVLKEILMNDVNQWRMINDLVRQVETSAPGVVLKHPKSGRDLRAVELVVSEPSENLGSGVNFDRDHIREMMEIGERDGIGIFYGKAAPRGYRSLRDFIEG